MRLIHPLLAGALLATPLAAQTAADSAVLKATQRVQAILGMPRRADEARRAGVPDTTIRSVIDILARNKVPPEEAVEILGTAGESAAEHGPTDNFGAFVQAQLAAGKRGRDLSAAIRAEHQARGKGRPTNAGGGDAAGGKRPEATGGRPDGAGQGGRPAGAGQGGRPEAAGAKRPDAATGGRPAQPAGKKPAADSASGKRPGNPNAKRP